MANKHKTSPANASYFKAYKAEDRWIKNKIIKLEKLVKKQPNNLPLVAKLDKALNNKLVRKSGRRSTGQRCKRLYKELGFEKNKPTDSMKLDITWYYGEEFDFSPNRGADVKGYTVAEQLQTLGLTNGRKYKKTS